MGFLTEALVFAVMMTCVIIGMIGLSYKITCERLDALTTEIEAQVEQLLAG
jgi:hypothetical protein